MVGSDAHYRAYPEPNPKTTGKEVAKVQKASQKKHRAFQTNVSAAARHYINHTPKGYRDDCSGFAAAIYNRAGAPLSGNTASMWALAQDLGNTHKKKRPQIGDLIFFDNTWDRNKNGRWDDTLTHVAVVVDVHADGTVLFAHSGTSKGRSLAYLNLLRPGDAKDESGKVLNEYLRRRGNKDPKKAGHLTGQLWRGFATFDQSDLTPVASR
jgi:cell wall-associated NlpC family hydrolase